MVSTRKCYGLTDGGADGQTGQNQYPPSTSSKLDAQLQRMKIYTS